jgi:hypothetical protein
MRKIKKLNNVFPKSRTDLNNSNNPNNPNNSNNPNNPNNPNNSNNHICKFKNFHEEHIEIPSDYPGDLWVHNNLVADRDKPLEYFDEDYLKEVYSNHKKICYGI